MDLGIENLSKFDPNIKVKPKKLTELNVKYGGFEFNALNKKRKGQNENDDEEEYEYDDEDE